MKKNDLLDWYTKRYKKSFNEKNIYEKLRVIIAEQLGIDVAQVVPEARLSDLGTDFWLDHPELMMAFEEEFDIEIPDEEAEEILTVQDTANYLLRSISAEPNTEITSALDELADSLDGLVDLVERHHVRETDDIKSLISEASNIDLIEKRNKTKRIFNLLQTLNITDQVKANELLECAMDHEYMAHSNKVEELHSLLNNTAINNLQSKHIDFTYQFTLLVIERAKERKRKKKVLITQEIERLRSSLAELE